MRSVNVLEREEWVRVQLREEIHKPLLVSLPETCRRLEAKLDALLSTAFFDELAHASSLESEFRKISDVVFEVSGKRYIVRRAVDTTDPGVLVVSLAGIGSGATRPQRRSARIRIDSIGRYHELEIVTDDEHVALHDLLGSVGKIVLEAGGKWIEQFVMLEIQNAMHRTGDELYAIIRSVLPETVTPHVWLFSVQQSEGIYVSDPISRSIGLKQSASRRVQSLESPIEQLAEFTTHVVDPNRSFAANVLASDSALEVDISHATYSYRFELAEESVFHTSRLVGQPLVREGRARLIAAYPADIRSMVEPILELQREEFLRVLEQSSQKLRNSLRTLRSYGVLPGLSGKFGEFMGGVIKQLVQP